MVTLKNILDSLAGPLQCTVKEKQKKGECKKMKKETGQREPRSFIMQLTCGDKNLVLTNDMNDQMKDSDFHVRSKT